jgi:four helix bundle protein
MRNFKQLKICQKGINIAIQSYRFTDTFPKEERFGLRSQINRSATSISSNIAEGSSRSSDKDYSRFVEISLGSSYELETQIFISQHLHFGEVAMSTRLLRDVQEEQKMLVSFIDKLNN